jgi:hypothetical protein
MAAVGGGQAAPPPKADMAPVLQQLNLASLRTRTQDLHNAISRILHAFTTQPSLKWSEVLGQFAMVNVELLNLVEDIKPILKVFVVYPKNVNAENSTMCSIAYNAVIKAAPGDGGRRGNYEGTNIVRHLQPPCSCTE